MMDEQSIKKATTVFGEAVDRTASRLGALDSGVLK